ncbi:Endoplasmic reticulum-Golgi intermediate compartment protein 3 [Wickerhamomyces ciferrii]|uniref:Endoplasmic reticulum-Golgi intermediate compartment protein n=1 Tax=Wickerhamomyces ciferrii (strain ATCC 14091 / BCRC 22168 / CBS 111 / JCM 3599 / NBRC 0793 / NRRL Y-1031 F-60-10) TaxID=1206466 RepID=K0KJ60_WICCF|nr:Endoplasmic reticulum-Golgi intermediate compartment protein 3 [Wickerhamomyces ciferrii]CCH41148.1 Endoplasmic reticulum-Golgi intermediate compartment protein 3 [Wickerhamomyces ciferrii]
MANLRSFDAFRECSFRLGHRHYLLTIIIFIAKVASTHEVRSTKGSYSTIMMGLFILFLTWVEVGQFFGGEVDHQFRVDNKLQRDLRINLDIVVAMPCNFIHTNVKDLTDDRFLASELLHYEGFSFFIPPGYKTDENYDSNTPDLDEVMAQGIIAEFRDRGDAKDSGAPACHIYGSIPVNKVSGDFHITAQGYGYRGNSRSHVGIDGLNFTHIISEFSFGEFYPYIHNPLDATVQITKEHLQSYQYYLSVVPTVYKKLGVEIETNQYSTSLQKKLYSFENKGVPGLFFKYDFEPISLIVEDKRIPFSTFLVRLATIYGGIIVVAKFSYKLFDKALIYFFGKRFASRGEEKKGSLLDGDEE